MSAGDFFKDVGCFGGPDEGFGILVVCVDVASYGGDELFEVLENASFELVLRQVSEEAFDHVEPTGRGRCEANVEAFVGFQPALDSGMFVGRVVVADQVDFLVGRYRLIDHAQELQPFLMSVFLLT